jgi:hypothetical protein
LASSRKLHEECHSLMKQLPLAQKAYATDTFLASPL